LRAYFLRVIIVKMKLTKKEVLHIAGLAKLSLNKEEEVKFEKQLSEIVNYVSELNEISLQGIEPTSQTTGLKNVFREDLETEPSLTPEKALSGTEETYNNYFMVPQIVSKQS